MVIGAGLAGLLAARVLADFYQQVTVLDRDHLPDQPTPRGGAPQDRHVHALLFSGLTAIEDLFPGLTDDLIAAGVPTGDVLADARSYFGGHRLKQTSSGLPGLSVSRPLLEHHVRARVAAQPTVTVADSCAVSGLRASPDGRRITGVDLDSGHPCGRSAILDADLVVDASGRTTRTPQWLTTLGLPAPREDRIAIDVGYVSYPLALPADILDGDIGIAMGPTAATPRGGALQRIEQDRWLVSLAGYGTAQPPVDPGKLLQFARTLVAPDIYQALRQGTPLAPPTRFRVPHTVRRRYDLTPRLPAGLLVVGDAACHFNPVYGQGMSVAARQCLILRQELDQPSSSPPRIRRRLARAAAAAWTMSSLSDLRMPQITGHGTLLARLGNRYADRMFRSARHDPVVARTFMRAANLVDAPTTLLRPAMLRRVLLGDRHDDGAGRAPRGEPASPPPDDRPQRGARRRPTPPRPEDP